MNKKGPGMVHLKKDERPLTLQTDKKIQLPFFRIRTRFASQWLSAASLGLSSASTSALASSALPDSRHTGADCHRSRAAAATTAETTATNFGAKFKRRIK